MLVVMSCVVVRFFAPFTTYALSCGKDAVWLGLSRGRVPEYEEPHVVGTMVPPAVLSFFSFRRWSFCFLSALFASTVAHLTEQKRIRYDLLQALAP